MMTRHDSTPKTRRAPVIHWIALYAALVMGVVVDGRASLAAIAYVQSNSVSPNNASLATLTVTLSAAQTAGDLNVVAVGWGSTSIGVSAVTDSKGNTYTLAVGPTAVSSVGSTAIYYAKNIAAASAGTNAVTITFSSGVPYPDVRVAEYSAINTTAPLDVTVVGSGTGTTSSTGSVTITNANDLLVASNWVLSGTAGAGSGFTQRVISGWDGDILEDEIVSAVGSYTATAPISPSAAWIMQMAAFKAVSTGDTTPPTAPTAPGATVVSSTQISITWAASTDNVGVTGYSVERCSGASCTSFAQIGTPTTTTYSDTGLTASTSYSYRIRATDAAGNLSTYSTTVSATTQAAADTTPPTAPTAPGATMISSTQINLTWTASTDNVGVTGYRVERCSGASCTSFAQIGTPTATTYSDTGLTASTSYSYRIRATDAAGNLSAYSTTVSTTTQAAADTTPPTAPTGLTASATAATQINLTWTASTDNVGVTGYRVERCSGASCTSFAQIGTPTATTYSDTGLTASTSYSYRIRATDAAGNLSAYSSTASATTPAAGSGPGGYWKFDEGSGTTTADASGNNNTGTLNNATWTTGKVGNALSFNGSTAYVTMGTGTGLTDLYLTGMTVSAWIKPASAGGNNAGRIVDKDNANSGWAFNMSGTTAVKFSVDQFLTTQPSRTSSATIALNTWQLVTATWDGSVNGGNIHVYINGVLADGASTNGSGATDTDAGSPFTIGNRTVDSARAFNGAIDEVRVYNRILSASEIAAVADTTAPGAPTGLGTTVVSATQINLSWTASTDNVGVTGYAVERCQGASCTTFVQIGTSATTTYSDTGLTASTAYSYRIRATDAAGNLSTYSSTASGTTSAGGSDTTPPTAPTAPGATAISSSQINLSWTASTDNVGVTGYRVERCSGTSCTTFAQIGTPTATTYSDTGLTASTPYSYRIRATDAAGNLSAYSTTASATTQSAADTTPPTTPTGLSAAPVSSTQINLTWTASTDNVAVTGYRVERCTSAGCSTFTQVGTPTTTSYSDAGLTASTGYSYRVRATDAAGNLSAYSGTASAATTSGNNTYTYDANGRLSTVTTSSGTVRYTYDAAGNVTYVGP